MLHGSRPSTRFTLPWLTMEHAGVSPEIDMQLARAMSKFSRGHDDSPLALHVTVTCDAAGAPQTAVMIDAGANVRFQFVRGFESPSGAQYATEDGSVADVDHATGHLRLTLNREVFDAPYSTWSDLMAAPLAATWRHHGYFPLHAAAVSLDHASTPLIVGASGSGKTTTALALVIAGGVWRSDDKVLIHETSGSWLAASLYANTNLAPATIAAHASLAFALDRAPINETNDKRPCLLTEVARAVDLSPFTPTALLFPKQMARRASALRPLDPIETLIRLTAQSPMSGDRGTVRRQHEQLVAIARTVSAWEIEAGRDVLDAPIAFAERVRDCLAHERFVPA